MLHIRRLQARMVNSVLIVQAAAGMLIPVLDVAGNQIAWIDHVNLEVGGLFRIGASTFSLRDDGSLQEVEVRRLGRASLIAMAANDAD